VVSFTSVVCFIPLCVSVYSLLSLVPRLRVPVASPPRPTFEQFFHPPLLLFFLAQRPSKPLPIYQTLPFFNTESVVRPTRVSVFVFLFGPALRNFQTIFRVLFGFCFIGKVTF